MANLPEVSVWEPGIYQLETVDFVLGGAGGQSNVQPNQLANRTLYLKGFTDTHTSQISAIQAVNSAQETKLTNIINSLPAHLRHTILAGPSSIALGVENALKILDATNRQVGLNDSDIDNIGGPIHIAFSDGYRNSAYVNSNDYILREGTSVPTASTWNMFLPTGNATHTIIAKYTPGTNVIDLDYITPPSGGGYVASVVQPLAASVPTRSLWYNPATSKHKLTTNGGTSYTDVICVLLGEVTISSGVAASVSTYPYQRQPYDSQSPIGSIIWMAANVTPLGGWLYCNGAEYNRTTYGRLYQRILTAYGTPSGGTVFKVPDLRGQFLRGFDDGAGVDSGRVFGSNQTDANKAHTHDLQVYQGGGGAGFTNPLAGSTGTIQTDTTESSGTESRPKNIAMKAWIKY